MQKLDAFIDEHGGMYQKLLNKLQEKPEMVEESSNDIPVVAVWQQLLIPQGYNNTSTYPWDNVLGMSSTVGKTSRSQLWSIYGKWWTMDE